MDDTKDPIKTAVGYMLHRRSDNGFRAALARAIRPEGELSGITAMGQLLGNIEPERRTGALRGLALSVTLRTDTGAPLGASLAVAHQKLYGPIGKPNGFTTSVNLLAELDLEPATQVLGNLLHRAHGAGVHINPFSLTRTLANWDDPDERRQILLDMALGNGGKPKQKK